MYQINRSVVILKPKKPFLDWLHQGPDAEPMELSLEDLHRDCTVLLIPDFDDETAALAYVHGRFRELFEVELGSWFTDPAMWPAKLSLELFKEWFDLELHSVVADLVDEELLLDDGHVHGPGCLH